MTLCCLPQKLKNIKNQRKQNFNDEANNMHVVHEVVETEIVQWEVADFFFKVDFLPDKNFKTWAKSAAVTIICLIWGK